VRFFPAILFLGRLLVAFAAVMLVPAAVALIYNEPDSAFVFAATAAVTLFFGFGMVFAVQGAAGEARRRSDLLAFVAAWPLTAAFAAAPLYFLGATPSLTDAYFEAVSGLTTSGASVIADLDSVGRAVIFWRAWMQWLGGLWTIVMAISILPAFGIGAMDAFRSAMPYGEYVGLGTRARALATTMAGIYGGLTIVCMAALWAAGLPPFDAIALAMSTLSTGGFATRSAGLAAFDSPLVEALLIVFMLMGAVNFTVFWALMRGRWRALIRDPEIPYLVGLTIVGGVVLAALLSRESGLAAGEALRRGVFTAVSALTTTGFTLPGETAWPVVLTILVLFLMFIGGSTASTAGGIKIMRARLALGQGQRELARLAHPHGVVAILYGGAPVSERMIQALATYFILFTTTLAGLAAVLALSGLAPEHALAMAAATLSNAGAGLGLVMSGPANFALLPDASKWVVSAGMIVGRLELVAALVIFLPAFWRR